MLDGNWARPINEKLWGNVVLCKENLMFALSQSLTYSSVQFSYGENQKFIMVKIKWPLKFFSSVQSLSHVWLFATPWIAARQASLSITNSQSLPKFMSIESVMPSNHVILCRPLLLLPSILPAAQSFQMSQLSAPGGQSTGVSDSTSVLPVNTQDWSPLGWTGWISLQSKGLSRVFSNTTVQKHQFFSAQLSL